MEGVLNSDKKASGELVSPEDAKNELTQLVIKARAGDEAAFDDLVELFTPRLFGMGMRMFGNAEAAEEAVQESWIRIHDKLASLNEPAAFPGWAMRVMLSRVHDEFRFRARQKNAREGLASFKEAVGKPQVQLTELERDELKSILRTAIDSLDEIHREVFVLREVEGMGHSEIASTLNIPEGTVWSRLSYARRYLRDYLMRRKDDVQ